MPVQQDDRLPLCPQPASAPAPRGSDTLQRMEQGGADARRAQMAARWMKDDPRTCVLIASGLSLPIAGTDQFHEFHAHPEFRYLAALDQPGSVLTFDAEAGWVLFAHTPSQEERVWVGDGVPLDEIAQKSGVADVRSAAELGAWLESRRTRTFAIAGNHDLVRMPAGYAIDDWRRLELEPDEVRSQQVSDSIAEARRAKDRVELAHMRAAADASKAGHLAAMSVARPGMTERELQVELESAFARAGALRTAYGSIVGAGPDAAVLHFAPGSRALREGDLVLIDAAAEWEGYAADITRTFPVSGTFSGLQRDIYELVAHVQAEAIAGVRPGVEYRDLHMQAARTTAQGLADLGILRGNAESLVERDAHAIFFPHGLGHMLGLSTHDAGGCLAGRQPSDRFGLKWLRADLPLDENYVVTIEPGIYFVRALLTDPRWRERYRAEVNWDRVDALLHFGGVRIEDDILVTREGAEVLSAGVPKKIDEIEAIRRETLRA